MFQISFVAPSRGGIRPELGEIKGLRNELGQFTSGLGKQYERNQAFATNLQQDVARRIKNHVGFGKRAGASTGRLLRATIDPKNIDYDAWSVGVGVESWLDQSQAKYWRTFEYGSAAVWRHKFAGTEILIWRKLGRDFAPHGANPGIRTVEGASDWDLSEGAAKIFRVTTVKKEIEPAGIYRDLAQTGVLREYGIQAAQRAMARMVGDSLVAGKDFLPPSVR